VHDGIEGMSVNPQDDAGAPKAGVGTDHTQVPRADAGLCQDIPEGTAAQIKPSLYSALCRACRTLLQPAIVFAIPGTAICGPEICTAHKYSSARRQTLQECSGGHLIRCYSVCMTAAYVLIMPGLCTGHVCGRPGVCGAEQSQVP
jgi:hypothetical protein